MRRYGEVSVSASRLATAGLGEREPRAGLGEDFLNFPDRDRLSTCRYVTNGSLIPSSCMSAPALALSHHVFPFYSA